MTYRLKRQLSEIAKELGVSRGELVEAILSGWVTGYKKARQLAR